MPAFVLKSDAMIRDLVFDFGGVVVDLDYEGAVEAFRRLGVRDAEHWLDRYRQRGVFLDVERGAITADGFLTGLGELCGREVSFAEAQHAWCAFVGDVPQKRLEALRHLRRNHRVFLLSNTNPFLMEWARSPRFTPEGEPLDAFFDKLYLSYEMRVVKPDREIFLDMILDAGLDPAYTLFVDDGRENVEAAAALGFPTYQPRPDEDWVLPVKHLAGD